MAWAKHWVKFVVVFWIYAWNLSHIVILSASAELDWLIGFDFSNYEQMSSRASDLALTKHKWIDSVNAVSVNTPNVQQMCHFLLWAPSASAHLQSQPAL